MIESEGSDINIVYHMTKIIDRSYMTYQGSCIPNYMMYYYGFEL